MTRDYTYEIKRIPLEPDTPIWIGSEGGMMTDVITPKAYIDLLIERKMKALDDRMIKYIERYRRERKKLREQRNNTYEEIKGMNYFEIINSFNPEEKAEFQRLYRESMDELRLRKGWVQQ